EDGIRDLIVTGVQTCALPILRAAAIAGDAGVKVEILDERMIAELGMGLLLGVARGSSEPPRLMVFRYDPPGAPAKPLLGLVGKRSEERRVGKEWRARGARVDQ